MALFGVNGESAGKFPGIWGKDTAYGGLLKSIVAFVDEDTLGITIYASPDKKVGFENKNDSKAPNGQVAPAIAAIKTSGIDVTKAAKGLDNLTAALKGTTPSRYDRAEVIKLLKSKGITLAQLAALEGKTGDDAIAEALKQVGATVAEVEGCLTAAAKAEKELQAATSGTDKDAITAAKAKLEGATGYDTTLYSSSIGAAAAKIATFAPPPPPSVSYSNFQRAILNITDISTRLEDGSIDSADEAALTSAGFSRELIAALKDGELTKAEARNLGISDVLFNLIANNMRAGETSEQTITLEKLVFAAKVIAERAEILNEKPEELALKYETSPAFVNRTNEELRAAKQTMSGHISINSGSLTITDCDSRIFDAAKRYFTANPTYNSNQIAAYLLRAALGLEKIDGIDTFNSGPVNVEQWLRTGRVEEEGVGTVKDKELKKIYDSEIKRDPALQRQRATEYVEKLIREKGVAAAEQFLASASNSADTKHYIDGLDTEPRVLLALYNAHLEAGQYDKAVVYASRLPQETHMRAFDEAVDARQRKITSLLESNLSEAQIELTKLGTFIEKMGVNGNKYNAVLYQLTVKTAVRLAGSGDAATAYALIETLPESGFEVKHGDTYYDQRTLSSRFEALIYVASEAGDLTKINELLAAEKAKTPSATQNPINIALALEARASVQTKKALTTIPKPKAKGADTPQGLREKAFNDLKEARAVLSGNTAPKAAEIAARLDRSAKQLIGELVSVLKSEARSKKEVSLMQEWNGTAAAGGGGGGLSVATQVDTILSSKKNRPEKVAALSTALRKLIGKSRDNVTGTLTKVKGAGFTINPIFSTEGKLTSISVS